MSFSPSNGQLSSASDVAFNNPANNEVLTFNTGLAKWANKAAPVTSVAGKTGAVSLAKTDVGLANVDNTSDASKPISTATQTALNNKQTASQQIPLVIVEVATGVWSADAPVRSAGVQPIEFRGTSDPADPTNGIPTPSNINDNDSWLQIT